MTRRLLPVLAIVAAVVAFAGWRAGAFGHGGVTDRSAEIRQATGASSCHLTDYGIVSKFTGAKEPLYDCTMAGGSEKCVTWSGGVATDSTLLARLVFANVLSGGRPACVRG